MLKNVHPPSQLPHTTIPQMQFPATHAPPVVVLTEKIPSQTPNCSRESPICLSVAARAASITAGSSAVYMFKGKGWRKCSSLVRAHIDSTRQNTYSCSNWLPLQQPHSASFIFQEKNIRLEQMGADQNRLHRTATV